MARKKLRDFGITRRKVDVRSQLRLEEMPRWNLHGGSTAAVFLPLRFLWLEASHVGRPVSLGAPVDVRDIFGRHPEGVIDVVDGSGGVIAPTANEIAKRRMLHRNDERTWRLFEMS